MGEFHGSGGSGRMDAEANSETPPMTGPGTEGVSPARRIAPEASNQVERAPFLLSHSGWSASLGRMITVAMHSRNEEFQLAQSRQRASHHMSMANDGEQGPHRHRQVVARWIEDVTDLVVPTSTEFAFRAALKDGAILCHLINAFIPPDTNKRIVLSDDDVLALENSQNIQSFQNAALDLGFPEEDLFSMRDLTANPRDASPAVSRSLHKLLEFLQWDGTVDQCSPPRLHRGADIFPDAAHAHMDSGIESSDRPNTPETGLDCGFDNSPPQFMTRDASCVSLPELRTAGLDIQKRQDGSMSMRMMMENCSTLLHHQMMSQQAAHGQYHYGNGFQMEGYGRWNQMLEGIVAEVDGANAQAERARFQSLKSRMDNLDRRMAELRTNGVGTRMARVQSCGNMGNCQHSERLSGIVEGEQEVARMQREVAELDGSQRELEAEIEREQIEIERVNVEIEEMGPQLDLLAASRKKVLRLEKENRDLYNTVQELQGSSRVLCRVGNTHNERKESVVSVRGQPGELGMVSKDGRRKVFKFDNVLMPGKGQAEVFEGISPLVRSAIDGHKTCVFSCGPPNTGKTHTMVGGHDGTLPKQGIIRRAVRQIFEQAACKGDLLVDCQVHIRMLRVSDTDVLDLLDSSPDWNHQILSVFDGEEAVRKLAASEPETQEILSEGFANSEKVVESMPGDMVVSVFFSACVDQDGEELNGELHLIDMASNDGLNGKSWFEQPKIEQIGQALEQLAFGRMTPPPALPTYGSILKGVFQKSTKAALIMHVSTDSAEAHNTLEALKIGARISQARHGTKKSKNGSGDAKPSVEETRAEWEQINKSKDSEIEQLLQEIGEFKKQQKICSAEQDAIQAEIEMLKEQLEEAKSEGLTKSGAELTIEDQESKELFLNGSMDASCDVNGGEDISESNENCNLGQVPPTASNSQHNESGQPLTDMINGKAGNDSRTALKANDPQTPRSITESYGRRSRQFVSKKSRLVAAIGDPPAWNNGHKGGVSKPKNEWK